MHHYGDYGILKVATGDLPDVIEASSAGLSIEQWG